MAKANRYTPDQEPPAEGLLREWLLRELGKISDFLDSPFVPEHTVAPSKPQQGRLVEADGSNWDPGRGEGIYFFDGTSWKKLAYLPIARGDLDTGLLNFIEPGHRLSVGAAGVAIPATDITAATALRWTPWRHKQTPIFNGTLWLNQAIAELTYTLHSSAEAADTNYNIWLDYNAGTPRLVRGPAWSSATAPTANDEPIGDATYGYLVNTGTITVQLSNNGGTASKAAGLLLYLGTIRTTGVAGQTEDSKAKRFVWNAWNRVRRPMLIVETTDNWPYSTATIRQARASTANQIAFVRGFDQDAVDAHLLAEATNDTAGAAFFATIGLDSTTARAADALNTLTQQAIANGTEQLQATYRGLPGRGYHFLAWLEWSDGTGVTTWRGDNGVPLLRQVGLAGSVFA